MKLVLHCLAAVVGVALVLAGGAQLVDDDRPAAATPAGETTPASRTSTAAVRPVADPLVDDPAVRVRDPLLVVNRDGSAALGANLQNVEDLEVTLTGVVVRADGRRLPVNASQMWLPVLPGDLSQVGAASDAGGFMVPDGLEAGTRASVEFWFDDGTCASSDVAVVTRTGRHRWVYPRTVGPIGPVTTDDPPAGAGSCESVPAAQGTIDR